MMRNRLPLVLLVLFVASCRTPNHPPRFESGFGPGHVAPGTSYVYRIEVEDRDGDSVRCALDWGDDTGFDTSRWAASPAAFEFEHAWQELGKYRVYVLCSDDRGAEATPFFFTGVSCETIWPPTPPDVDSTWGPDIGFERTRYRFGARGTDINGDRMRFQFRWGDGWTSEWTRWVRPGTREDETHDWLEPGRYTVEVRAEDRTGEVSGWFPVTELDVVGLPELKWERPLDEPTVLVPMKAGQTVVVVDRGVGVKLNAANGNLLSEYYGPGEVLGTTGSEAGVFLRDEDRAWGFTPNGNWQTSLAGEGPGMVLGPTWLFVPARDTGWFLDARTGVPSPVVAKADLNWVSPVAASDGLLYCLGDSVRAVLPTGAVLGSWQSPALVPDEVAVDGLSFAGLSRLSATESVVQSFDSTGTAWQRVLGALPSLDGPNSPVAANGMTFVATRDTVYAFDREGEVAWRWMPGAAEHVSSGTPCLGGRGDLFVGVSAPSGGALVALDSTGSESWRVPLECRAPEGMVLARDSIIYGVGMDEPTAFAVFVSEPPAPSGWPCFRHDAGLTGRAATP